MGKVLVGLQVAISQLLLVTAGDPGTFVGAAVILISVALIAAALPAWRSSRVGPMTALRYE
jgi:ABC-type antimicrobial peptide transport system permease subunit